MYCALANDTRREFLELLKHPEVHFESEHYRDLGLDLAIRHLRVSQMLQNTGFSTSHREGRWTYYRRDEAKIREIAARMRDALEN